MSKSKDSVKHVVKQIVKSIEHTLTGKQPKVDPNLVAVNSRDVKLHNLESEAEYLGTREANQALAEEI